MNKRLAESALKEWDRIQTGKFWGILADRWAEEQNELGKQLGKGYRTNFPQLRYLQGRYAQCGEFNKMTELLIRELQQMSEKET